MSQEDANQRLDKIEDAIVLLTKLSTPKPKTFWDRLSTDKIRDAIYIIGIPALLFTTYLEFDKFYLSRENIRLEEKRNTAISRLDQLQDINSEIYQLQTQGDENVAFALIEAKRGQIARLTDTVYLTWVEQPEMLKRHDLNALAEALLVQSRTDDALRVASTVAVDDLKPIDAIDQQILKARIQFAQGPAQDIEAARQHLREAVPLVEEIERSGSQFLMQEKMLQVRLINEAWLGEPCETLAPMADALAELRAFNLEAGSVEDQYQSAVTVRAVRSKCRP
ncbi:MULTISPECIES: hypothetical protein [unclassified Ruegeria]|uniref:hypothetical protein n=1 Tax=unclassified Ruegeria TaxID=2625375 RepID=UPI001489064E|nr:MULTISPECIES: hypothetical protein [unclassified Ruegeria]NOD78892.1 hypothetical protein [Ruegeria sp. HKCCD4332]NOD91085.1 hypothetical protein [Ruegeria sp. HKCCD4318]NOE16282.1 hypothetical protein [Ruegeria sp. HKCCD4318-2]NOG07481.1 hypothetical protein [Ruegeria sp. HKCCD4315]